MFDADEELAILSGDMHRGRSFGDEELRVPITRLPLRAAETIHANASIADATRRMKAAKIGSLAVVDGEGSLVGIVTERDLLMKVMLEPVAIDATPVSAIMTPDPETLLANDLLLFVMNRMHVGGFRHVPIVDDGNRPLHVVSIRDVVAYVLGMLETTVANVPPDADPLLRRFA